MLQVFLGFLASRDDLITAVICLSHFTIKHLFAYMFLMNHSQLNILVVSHAKRKDMLENEVETCLELRTMLQRKYMLQN